jgi:hypothetical protein
VSNPTWTIPSDSMTGKAEIITRSQFAAATGPDDRIYMAGGLVTGIDGTVDVYNPIDRNTNTPTSPKSMSVARYAFALVTAWDGGIWAIGGFSDPGTGTLSDLGTATDSVERYDVVLQAWTTDPKWSLSNNPLDPSNPSNVPRGAVAAAVGPGNRIYVLGGLQYPPRPPHYKGLWPSSSASPNAVFSLDPFNPSLGWRTEPSMTYPRAFHTAATGIDGNIYVFGGGAAPEMFDGTNWNPVDSIPLGTDGFATAAAPDGSIYSAGGYYPGPNSLAPPTQVVAYSTSSAAWISVNNMPYSKNLSAAAAAEGTLYVAGGAITMGDPGLEAYGPLPATHLPSAVAWYRFDDLSNPFLDSTANSNTGTNFGTGRASGKVGTHGRNFTGTGYGEVNDSPSLHFDAGDLSVEFWIFPSAAPRGVVPILDNRTRSGHYFTGYYVFLDAGGKVGFQLANGKKVGTYISTLAINPGAGDWTHVAISVDRTSSNPQVTFYINGVNANGPWTGTNSADVFVPLPGSITNSAILYIGKSVIDQSYLHGVLDELTLYNKALSWIEARSIFLAGSAGKA